MWRSFISPDCVYVASVALLPSVPCPQLPIHRLVCASVFLSYPVLDLPEVSPCHFVASLTFPSVPFLHIHDPQQRPIDQAEAYLTCSASKSGSQSHCPGSILFSGLALSIFLLINCMSSSAKTSKGLFPTQLRQSPILHYFPFHRTQCSFLCSCIIFRDLRHFASK